MKRKITILDCTLRDGGYVNNWEFDAETSCGIIDGIYSAGVRNIEIGIMGKKSVAGKQTKFSSVEQMLPILERRKSDCSYYVMMNQAEREYFNIPLRSEKTPDAIRLAFFKPEMQPALSYAEELIDKGYDIFLQAMATFMYSADELKNMIEMVNKVHPKSFYIVDSFGTMYNEDVRAMADNVEGMLDESVIFGFHAHNNIQMAYSNVIEFIKTNSNRALMADSSIFGMGRGAGNVPTELLMKFLNERCGCSYDIMQVLKTHETYIKPIFEKYYWGFSPKYFLTADKHMNSAYGWYLGNKNIENISDIDHVLSSIPKNIAYTLSVSEADKAIESLSREGGHGKKA